MYERSQKALQHRHIKYIDSDTFLSGSRSTFRKLCYLKAAVCRLLPFLVVGVSVYMSHTFRTSCCVPLCRFLCLCSLFSFDTYRISSCFTRHIDERARASVPANTAYNSVHINFHYTDPKQCVLHLYFFPSSFIVFVQQQQRSSCHDCLKANLFCNLFRIELA